MLAAAAVFLIALVAIATERVHRTKVALLGGVVALLIGVIEQEAAIEAIDFNTIGLLAGMMLIVRITEPTGVYDYLASGPVRSRAGGRWRSWSPSRGPRRCSRPFSTT